MKNKTYCIIMAGGIGRRFWPLSRQNHPKQFADLLGTGTTLIQQTFERMKQICRIENIFVVTGTQYKELTLKQIPELKESQILTEPNRRNTAPCIAYANERIKKINPQANIIVTPSDHLIIKEQKYIETLQKGLAFTENQNILLTIGIKPHRPETNYGYIQIEDSNTEESFRKVKNFTEKPDKELADFFVESNEFFWNSGIYIWNLQSITHAFELHLPDMLESFRENTDVYGTPDEQVFINKIYAGCKNTSIDYGIMEKADNVYAYCADLGWSDLGSWQSLFENREKNEEKNVINHNNILTYNTHNTFISTTPTKIAAVQGLDGYVVAETDDALLICKKSDEGKIREIINDIKFKKGDKYI